MSNAAHFALSEMCGNAIHQEFTAYLINYRGIAAYSVFSCIELLIIHSVVVVPVWV